MSKAGFKVLRLFNQEIMPGQNMDKVYASLGYGMKRNEQKLVVPIYDVQHHYRTIYSDMQTKKTPMMGSVSIYTTGFLRMPVFLLVQNRNADLFQLRRRLTELFGQWHTCVEKSHLTEELKSEMVVLEPERGKFATQQTIRDAMQGGVPKVFVALFSATDINPILEMVNANEIKRYAIILDEADFLDNGSKTSAVSKAFSELSEQAAFVVNVTATPLTTLSHRECLQRHFIIMSPPPYYKGLAQTTWKDLPLDAEPCNGIEDDPFEKDPNLVAFLHRYHRKYPPTVSQYNEKIPNYVLMRLGRTIEPQLKAADLTHKLYPKTVVITWNGGEQGTTVRSALLPRTSITIDNKIVSEYKDGVHHFNNLHISQLISYLHKNRLNSQNKLRFEHIIVYAGVMADRGITFGADNYTDCIKNQCAWWHLTDLYYIGSKNNSVQNLSNVLQACGRLCGVYNDNVRLTLYSNWVDGIREGYKLEQEIIHRVQTSENPDENILETLTNMKICKDKKIKNMRPTNSAVKSPWKWMKGSDEEYGGWTEEKRSEILEGSRHELVLFDRAEEKVDEDVTEDVTEEVSEEVIENIHSEIERLIGRFKVWAGKTSKIAKFMWELVPGQKYNNSDIQDMLRTAGFTLGITAKEFTRYHREHGPSSGYGEILVQTGSQYMLNPALDEAFIKIFKKDQYWNSK